MEELWPSFRTSESEGVWKREGMQEELQKVGEVVRYVHLYKGVTVRLLFVILPVR